MSILMSQGALRQSLEIGYEVFMVDNNSRRTELSNESSRNAYYISSGMKEFMNGRDLSMVLLDGNRLAVDSSEIPKQYMK